MKMKTEMETETETPYSARCLARSTPASREILGSLAPISAAFSRLGIAFSGRPSARAMIL